MNAHYYRYLIIAAVLAAILIIAAASWLHRVLLLVKRRCRRKGCGNQKVERVHHVFMSTDDELATYWYWAEYPDPKQPVSGMAKHYIGMWKRFNPDRYIVFRFYIRRVLKLTFVSCPRCNLVELVKVDFDPMSIWHRNRIKRHSKEQFMDLTPELRSAAEHRFRQLRHGRTTAPDSELTDTPPFSPVDLLDAAVEDLTSLLDNPAQGRE